MSESLGETESLDDLMARHRRETKDLQAKTTAAKKAAGSDKKKKKEATEEGERAEEMMRQRHKAEKEACEARERNAGAVEAAAKDGDGAAVQAAVEAIDALEMNERDDVAGNVETGEQKKKRNKARERAQRKAAELDEVRKQAAEEAKNLPNLKRIEEEQIKKLVEKEGLKVKDIAADGHCLYSAVADQLGDGRDYKQLRKLAAQFIRDNRDDFYPFMSGSDGEPLDDAGFDQYCDDLANTAVWGGGLELRALALLLARPIKVYQAHGSMLEVGEGSEEPLRISYHRHALALGAHYNSLRKGA